MPVVHPTVSDVRTSFGGLVRGAVNGAAGADKIVNAQEASTLRPFLQEAVADLGAGDHSVNDVVDAAMVRATSAWAGVNQATGSGATKLSLAEIKALTKKDADLGALTTSASSAAFLKLNPVVVALDGAPAGVTLTKSGSRFTISADSTVPVGTAFNLVVDGKALPLQRGPAGIDAETLVAPEGYGLAVVSRSVMTDPVQTATVSITRDDPSWLKPAQLAKKATAGLLDYVKHTRIYDADWSDYFPTTWAGNVAQGVPAAIAGFVAKPDTQVVRNGDNVTYIGRGPFDLYTEVTVSKKDGKVSNVLVEID